MQYIRIRGARTHNLKNIDLDLPRDKLVVITGLSGSGKSSLAFDTLYAEGQRRYVESLSAYARQFLAIMEKPDVDLIEGLSPAISIEQKSTSHNPRSTVGTVTEIYDYLRLLFARAGQPVCPKHNISLEAQTVSQMVDMVLALDEGTKVMLLAPVVRERKGEHRELLVDLIKQGFIRARIDGKIVELDQAPKLSLNHKHTIEVIVDRIKVRMDLRQRLAESFETALRLADGLAGIAVLDDAKLGDKIFSAKFACPECGYSLTALEPRLFSFNNPVGACAACDGLGVQQLFDPNKVVINPEFNLSSGAIRGWDCNNPYYFSMLTSLAKHYDIDLNKPFCKLPKHKQDLVLYGSGDEEITFHYVLGNNKKVVRKIHPFEGVIPNMTRRYRETESEAVREELAKYLSASPCPECKGTRLRLEARYVLVGDKNLPEIAHLTITDALDFFKNLHLSGSRGAIASKILKEVCDRLSFLVNVGLEYLSLDRSAETLSGGEAQRIRLASQIGSGLVGVMYILDEPTIGLHQRDNQRLLKTLTYLRDLGNTVIVVEHDEEAILSADYVVDIGPGAGVHGGQVIFQGTPKELVKSQASLTGQYLSGAKQISVPKARVSYNAKRVISLCEAKQNNLKGVDVKIPIGLFTCVTGVSGSGKSSLINDVLYPLATRAINGSGSFGQPKNFRSVDGLEFFDKVIDIDQSPIGRTPRSNPATYTGLFTGIRELFAGTQEARSRGYQIGRFSFNVKGGRCEACQGDGLIKVEMHFLPDVYVVCDVCQGRRYNRETLEVRYKGKNIREVLEMTVEEARDFFAPIPSIAHKLQTLLEVGLSYIRLGQSATTLSGGEAQRIKLAKELSRRDTGQTLYILDEPTTGLHFHDIKQLLGVLQQLRDRGNTIVVIEHNLDVIKTADWIIDLGPEGGDRGGRIIAYGTPETVAKNKNSYTGQFLHKLMQHI
ncbi:MAG: excinuclease ABC subunit A [Gammaproteobacteria bacterium GWE2_37_16]|nr:MAG: excinuclease ABC subunit A [Gammaproteobacteria bacterium GWE2_37_16]